MTILSNQVRKLYLFTLLFLTAVVMMPPTAFANTDANNGFAYGDSTTSYLFWNPSNPPANATGFVVFRSEDGQNFNAVSDLLSLDTDFFQEDGLSEGVHYYYVKVKYQNGTYSNWTDLLWVTIIP